MTFLNCSAVCLFPVRWFDSVRGRLHVRRRRRSSLRRLYELSGDLKINAGLDQNRSGNSSFLPAGAGSFRPNFFRVIVPSFINGAFAAWLTASGRPAIAGLLLIAVSGMVLFCAMRRRQISQAGTNQFLADYPATLTAMASSMKAGMTPLMALERAVKLLDAGNALRSEVLQLVGALRRGVPRETAIDRFAEKIEAPELELFRRAFLLVLINGGRFTPTLERLAFVSRERCSLIHSAGVSTQSMRMTANILIVIAPILVGVVSLGSADYWKVFQEFPTAGICAAAGTAMIIFGYLMLRTMSNFKP